MAGSFIPRRKAHDRDFLRIAESLRKWSKIYRRNRRKCRKAVQKTETDDRKKKKVYETGVISGAWETAVGTIDVVYKHYHRNKSIFDNVC